MIFFVLVMDCYSNQKTRTGNIKDIFALGCGGNCRAIRPAQIVLS
jgi:hypothetical protein